MTEKYSLDIGFNKELLSHPTNSFAALLTPGFTLIDAEGNPVYLGRHFRKGDRLVLTAYNFTLGPAPERAPEPSSDISDMSVEISFSPALSYSGASPVAFSKLSSFKIYPSQGPGGSTVFEQAYYRFFIEPDLEGATFPQSQLQTENKEVGGAGLELMNIGHFYFTILLSVTWKDGVSKNFRVDPEMIVTPDIGDPVTVQGSLNCSTKR